MLGTIQFFTTMRSNAISQTAQKEIPYESFRNV